MMYARLFAICISAFVGAGLFAGGLLGWAISSWGPPAVCGCIGLIFGFIIFCVTSGELR